MKKISVVIIMIIGIGIGIGIGIKLESRNEFVYYNDSENVLKLAQEKITQLEKELKHKNTYKIIASAYTISEDECDNTPFETALGTTPVVGKTVAVSRDLSHLLGHRIYIPGWGVKKVEDLMNKRFKSSIDILMPSKKMAMEFGKKSLSLVVLN